MKKYSNFIAILLLAFAVNAFAQGSKLSELPSITTPSSSDLLYVVVPGSGTPDRKWTYADMKAAIAASLSNIALSQLADYTSFLAIFNGSDAYCPDAQASDTYVCNRNVPLTAYVLGSVVDLKVNTINTGPPCVNVNSLGCKTIVQHNGDALTDGLMQAGLSYRLTYDGTNFRLPPAGGGGSGTVTGSCATANVLAKFTSASVLDCSSIADDGSGNVSHGDVSGNHHLWTYTTPTANPRTITVPDRSGSIPLVSDNALGAIPVYWDLDLVGVSGGVAAHIWNDDPLSTACTPLAVTGTNRTTGYCTFPDSDGDYGRQITRYLPTGWTGALDAEIWWKTTGSGNARFQIQIKCYADDEADDAAYNTASVVTAAAGTSARPNKTTISGITTTGCAAGELMRVRFFRNRTEGSDTLDADLDVEKVVLIARVLP